MIKKDNDDLNTPVGDNTDDKNPSKKDQNKEAEYLKKIAELEDSLKRAQADFLNFKRRTEEERMNSLKYSGSSELLKLLPVFDDFARAFSHIPEDIAGNDWVKGVIQIEQHFVKILNDIGVKKIECLGMPANHIFHEVVSQTKGKKDIIVQEVEIGYMYNDKVIRVSKVIVGNGEVK